MAKTVAYASDEKKGKVLLNMSVGALVAIIVSLALILVFALFIKWFDWSDGVITPANIIIKIISIAIGVLFVCKDGKGGIVRGGILGAIYIALCFLVFSLLNGTFVFGLSLLYDLILGVVAGAVLGVIVVNLKR